MAAPQGAHIVHDFVRYWFGKGFTFYRDNGLKLAEFAFLQRLNSQLPEVRAKSVL